MPRIIITTNAASGLERCREFLLDKNLLAVKKAAQAIANSLNLLRTHPNMGRPVEDEPHLRELIIEFGETGYVALYRYNTRDDIIYILAFRHQKELAY